MERLGIYAMGMDVHRNGLSANSNVRPHGIIRSLTELVPAR
ncbi:hypothetical protein [Bradyrhizobium oligotrophicum]|nr:hypothetical protein [Bradyrhizobium oligotrophicum]